MGALRRRPLSEVLREDALNFVYFFTPLVVIHNVAWLIKLVAASADPRGPWEMVWHWVLDNLIGNEDRLLFVYGTVVVTTAMYWLTGAFFMLLDYTQWPAFLYKYKIQVGKNAPPDTKKVIQVIAVVLFNQLLGFPAAAYMYSSWKEGAQDLYRLPSVYTVFGMLFVCMILHDAGFYHGHRLLHHRLLYKHMHKKHHEWTAPIAAVAEYAHPVEHVLSGQIPSGLGVMLLRPPLPVIWLWYVWLGIQIQTDHSGYHFPLMFSNEFHDFHHLRFHTSYGWLHFWDWFYGTDEEFWKSGVIKDRHFRLHTLKSAREVVPDPVKTE